MGTWQSPTWDWDGGPSTVPLWVVIIEGETHETKDGRNTYAELQEKIQGTVADARMGGTRRTARNDRTRQDQNNERRPTKTRQDGRQTRTNGTGRQGRQAVQDRQDGTDRQDATGDRTGQTKTDRTGQDGHKRDRTARDPTQHHPWADFCRRQPQRNVNRLWAEVSLQPVKFIPPSVVVEGTSYMFDRVMSTLNGCNWSGSRQKWNPKWGPGREPPSHSSLFNGAHRQGLKARLRRQRHLAPNH